MNTKCKKDTKGKSKITEQQTPFWPLVIESQPTMILFLTQVITGKLFRDPKLSVYNIFSSISICRFNELQAFSRCLKYEERKNVCGLSKILHGLDKYISFQIRSTPVGGPSYRTTTNLRTKQPTIGL